MVDEVINATGRAIAMRAEWRSVFLSPRWGLGCAMLREKKVVLGGERDPYR
jgi:hypothetical protein